MTARAESGGIGQRVFTLVSKPLDMVHLEVDCPVFATEQGTLAPGHLASAVCARNRAHHYQRVTYEVIASNGFSVGLPFCILRPGNQRRPAGRGCSACYGICNVKVADLRRRYFCRVDLGSDVAQDDCVAHFQPRADDLSAHPVFRRSSGPLPYGLVVGRLYRVSRVKKKRDIERHSLARFAPGRNKRIALHRGKYVGGPAYVCRSDPLDPAVFKDIAPCDGHTTGSGLAEAQRILPTVVATTDPDSQRLRRGSRTMSGRPPPMVRWVK